MDDSSAILDSLQLPTEEKKEESAGAKTKATQESTQQEAGKAGKTQQAQEAGSAGGTPKQAADTGTKDEFNLPEINIDPSLDIEGLRDLRQEALRQKRMLIDKKAALTSQIQQEVDSTQQLKKERDDLNAKVKEAKAERQKITDRVRELSKPLAGLSKELETYKGLRPSKSLKEELEKAEWAYQTQSLSPAKSHNVWTSIEDLSEQLKRAKARDKVWEEFKRLDREIVSLKQEQAAYHMSVLTNARDSEQKHKMLSDVYARIDEIREKRRLVGRKLDVPLGKLKALDLEIKKRRDELTEERANTRYEQDAINHRILNKKAREVEERFKKTGKLTTDDLLVIQQADLKL